MFKVHAVNLRSGTDTIIGCETLDEALAHLRELVQAEVRDPAGPIFDRYCLTVDRPEGLLVESATA